MNNFDLRKFLAEGKLYKKNLVNTRSEAEQDAKVFHEDLVDKYGFDAVANALEALYDNAEEGGAGYENIADLLKMDNSMLVNNLTEGKDKSSNIQKLIAAGYSKSSAEDFADEFEQGGSKVPQRVKDILTNESVKSKMKMSELKAKIRTEILAELTLNEDDEINIGGEETQADVDFYEGLEEATKDGEGEVPSKDKDTDVDIIDKEKVDIDIKKKPRMSMKVDDNFLDQLEDLKDEADAIGDNKLERQIDNTITYFTRQHIAKDTNESLELEEADDELEGNDMDLVRSLEAELMEGYSEFQRVGRGRKKTAARNKGEEEVYGAGVKKGEEIEKKKLKETMKESLEILKMKKLAGLLSEGEYAKALLREMEEISEDKLPTIKISKDIYYFDKLDRLDTKDNVDEKYHDKANLVFKKGQTVKDDTKYEDSEYKMITSSKSLKKGIDYISQSINEVETTSGNSNFESIKQSVIDKLEREYQKDIDSNYMDTDIIDQVKSATDIDSLEKIIFTNIDDQYDFLFPIYKKIIFGK
jgi:hypothetical protein